MRIEELLEQLLFENFNQLANLYDQVYDDALMKNSYIENLMIDAMMTAEPLNPTFGSPIDVFAFLVRNNQPIVEQDGGSGDPQLRDVNFWVSKFSQAAGKGAAAYYLIKSFLIIIETSAGLAVEKKDFRENKDNYDVIHKGDNWILFKPHHKAASCRLGNDTNWCISSRSENYFDDYNENSDVYIIHTRNDKYSIIASDGDVIEVQDSDNNRGQQDIGVHREFFIMLKNDGVDLEVLFDKIGLDSGRYTDPHAEVEINVSIDIEQKPNNDLMVDMNINVNDKTIRTTYIDIDYNSNQGTFHSIARSPISMNEHILSSMSKRVEKIIQSTTFNRGVKISIDDIQRKIKADTNKELSRLNIDPSTMVYPE